MTVSVDFAPTATLRGGEGGQELLLSMPTTAWSIPPENQVMTVFEKTLAHLDERLWDEIAVLRPKVLRIKMIDGSQIYYTQVALDRLTELHDSAEGVLPIELMTKRFSVAFSGGHVLSGLTGAQLSLCGEYFRGMLQNSMCETRDCSVSFVDNAITSGVFLAIFNDALGLNAADSKPLSSELDVVTACNYLQYGPVAEPLPEGAIGREQWKEIWGDPGPVPLPPPEKVALAAACGGLLAYVPSTINGQPVTFASWLNHVNRTGRLDDRQIQVSDAARALLQDCKIEKARWVVIDESAFTESLGESRAKHESRVARDGAELPDGFVLAMLMHARYCLTGRKPWPSDRAEGNYVRCVQREVDGRQVVVGGFSSLGLWLSYDWVGSDYYLGVVSLR